jgi:decaprenyl-phosphate phosphoribosyltransferase
LWPYVQIARPDHWIKNVFVLPGIVVAYFFYPEIWQRSDILALVIGFVAVCLTASSNYVLNEVLDAERDSHHPVKKFRPIPSGKVNRKVALAEWILLGVAGIGLGLLVSIPMALACAFLWVMGTIYNIPPIRLKDVPYADVLCESINNPIRMAMGWYMTGLGSLPPASVLMAYWMFGAFLMATKRFAEYRAIGDPERAARYRNSFAFYTEQRLQVSLIFYAALFAMFAGVFIARYHMELVLVTPIVAYAMAYYLHLGYKENSPAQYPERLYKAHKLIALVVAAFLGCGVLLLVDIPIFQRMLDPWHAPRHQGGMAEADAEPVAASKDAVAAIHRPAP